MVPLSVGLLAVDVGWVGSLVVEVGSVVGGVYVTGCWVDAVVSLEGWDEAEAWYSCEV